MPHLQGLQGSVVYPMQPVPVYVDGGQTLPLKVAQLTTRTTLLENLTYEEAM